MTEGIFICWSDLSMLGESLWLSVRGIHLEKT